MTGKKLLTALIVPLFAVGMVACQVEDEPDVYIEETQVPVEEPIIIEETYTDTVEAHEFEREDDLEDDTDDGTPQY